MKTQKVTLPELDAMSMKPSHTPTPWEAYEGQDYNHLYGGEMDHSGNPIAEVAKFEDAAHIAKCVNAHQPLIRALLEAQASLIGVSFHSQKKVNEIIEQALAQAEGK